MPISSANHTLAIALCLIKSHNTKTLDYLLNSHHKVWTRSDLMYAIQVAFDINSTHTPDYVQIILQSKSFIRVIYEHRFEEGCELIS